ncbi:MAG TPA: response regulator [Rhodocyclaceae bacterium]
MALRLLAPVDLLPLAAFAAAKAAPFCLERGVALRNECRAEDRVLADGEALQALLAGLLAEAAVLAGKGGALCLEQQPACEDRARLALRIAGAGSIELQDLARSFRRSAESLGAELGTAEDAVWLELRQVQAPVPQPEAAAPAGGTASVLYIEDNPSNRRLVATVLRKAPEWRLLTAADGVHGLAEARRLRPDVILTDINIPGLDGYELLRELRRLPETAAIPVVAISAEAQPEDIARARAAGFRDYLCKPFKPAELIAALRAARVAARQPGAG